ncbi:hypothetical protein IHE44_0014923 [Lamprotornis superbus]|uniref:SAM domain-containing protein n=1 Tax=Lamprotornis superbus TaxID=245042 RepID=A0A835U1E0_9PASS|nr:hypothetical protein IHE44_0014923 [Lamprotornis superbus]
MPEQCIRLVSNTSKISKKCNHRTNEVPWEKLAVTCSQGRAPGSAAAQHQPGPPVAIPDASVQGSCAQHLCTCEETVLVIIIIIIIIVSCDARNRGVIDLFHLTEVDLRKLGIENQGHRTHLISNILLLQEVKQKREPKMIAAGKLSSLPRNSPVNHQFSLASSMDLLTTKPSPIEHRSNSFQGISIHGTLPRKKKGTVPSRSCEMFSHMGTLHYTRARQQPPFIQDIIEEYPPEHGKSRELNDRDQNILDPTLEYVKICMDK